MLDASDVFYRAVLDGRGLSGRPVRDQPAAVDDLPGGDRRLGGGLVFLLALFGILASLAQLLIMLARGAVIVVLVGVLPVAAGSAMTEMGFAWFKKLWGWIFAFVLYKPAAAIVYAASFALIKDSKELIGVVSGYVLIILSVFALAGAAAPDPAGRGGRRRRRRRGGGGRGGGDGGDVPGWPGKSAPAPTAPRGLEPPGRRRRCPSAGRRRTVREHARRGTDGRRTDPAGTDPGGGSAQAAAGVRFGGCRGRRASAGGGGRRMLAPAVAGRPPGRRSSAGRFGRRRRCRSRRGGRGAGWGGRGGRDAGASAGSKPARTATGRSGTGVVERGIGAGGVSHLRRVVAADLARGSAG